MKIPIVFLVATTAMAAATSLRGLDQTADSNDNNFQLAIDSSLPEIDEAQEPVSRELRTTGYRTKTWGGGSTRNGYYKSRSGTRKRSTGRTKTRSGHKKTGTSYSIRTTDSCNTLFIVKDDRSRTTSDCAEDTAYEFRRDFDKVVIATSDRQAKNGDIVAFVDGDTYCEDLWYEIEYELNNPHLDRTFYVYYGDGDRYFKYKKNNNKSHYRYDSRSDKDRSRSSGRRYRYDNRSDKDSSRSQSESD